MNRLFFITTLLLCGYLATADPIVLRPVRSDGVEKLIVYFNGALVSNAAYVDACTKIQESSPLKLWIVIPSFVGNLPDPLTAPGAISDAIQRVKQAGFTSATSQDVFVAGHSLGGVVAGTVAANGNYGGLILFGSYVKYSGGDNSTAGTLLTYPIPVLTLTAELDGLTRVTRIGLEVRDFLTFASMVGKDTALTKKPVVMIAGATHSQFASNVTVKGDILTPEVDEETAQNEFAAATSAFLTLLFPEAVNNDPGALAAAKAVLASGFQFAQETTEAFMNLLDYEQSGEYCAQSQHNLVASSPNLAPLLQVQNTKHDNLFDFSNSKPSLSQSGEMAVVMTSSRNSYAFNPFDVSTNPVAATQTQCKLKSQDAVASLLKMTASGTEATCSVLNGAAFAMAVKTQPQRVVARYYQRGKQLSFGQDSMASTGITWLSASLAMNPDSSNPNVVNVVSPALETSVTTPLVPGMHYCTLLSPARAAEWILVDSLK